MDKYDAQELVKITFQNPFDKGRYSFLIRNLLNHFDETKAFHARGYVQEKYKQVAGIIKTYERIGTYTDPEGNKIDLLIVYLQKDDSIERARTTLRNFVADYLKNREEKDAGLVAFVSPNAHEWRFSFVKMEYRLIESPTGRIKAKEEFTPAKRYSFLVGESESTHTAQSSLVPILEDDVNEPTLSRLENAFNIERVTKEFFEKYRELFLGLKESLDKIVQKDKKVKTDFAAKGVNTVDFTKKLLGQIVFLYFLQKKGWFGVSRDEGWGTGPKNFLRLLFWGQIAAYKNFFNEILEPLFYEALALERTDDFYSRLNCKIPFLNGGLFDPIGNYDWVHTDINLPNDLFSNSYKTKEGDIGTGILDVFDRYNFTVKEDEPLEKEVAVDPEMLGKVFENLLEVKDRKSKGTYYTPREIVHYMCQESLINYLLTELSSVIPSEARNLRKDIETLIQYGESAVEHDSRVEQEGKETLTYSYKLPELIRKNAQLIDGKLKNIRVCDPAIGSGAFPVGMMNEIVRTRNTLTNYLEDKEDRSIYNFKRDAIQNSLYGVDIDPGAVEIAKLRLWLSLVVDEEDIKQIKPLPNLDYKIMQGNSLLEKFEGVQLFDDRLLNSYIPANDDQIKKLEAREKEIQKNLMTYYQRNPLWMKNQKIERPTELYQFEGALKRVQLAIKDEKGVRFQIKDSNQNALFGDEQKARKIWEKLQSLQKDFFETAQKGERDELKKQVEQLEWELIEATLKEQKKESSLKKLEQYKRTNIKPFFLWKLHFSEVFQEKGGFDIVIANPPYISHVNFNKLDKKAISGAYKTFKGRADIYVAFYEKGLNLLKENGHLTYITPNKFFRAGYGSALRNLLSNESRVITIIDFGDTPIFDATTYPCIIILRKKLDNKYHFSFLRTNSILDITLKERFIDFEDTDLKENLWSFDNIDLSRVWKKIKLTTIPLKEYIKDQFYRGIVTGLNEAFIIDSKKREEFISKNPINEEIIKPYLKGKDVKRWKTNSNSYLIFSYHGIDIDKYPEIEDYLSQFRKKLEGRATSKNHKWYELQQPQTGIFTHYEKIKIISTDIAKRCEFTLDSSGSYIDATIFCIPINDLYLLALLNSSLMEIYYRSISSIIRGSFLRFKKIYLDLLPIKIIPAKEQERFIKIITQILSLMKNDKYIMDESKQKQLGELEREIDGMVYKLYGLTPVEIAIVEGKNG